jgi:hypothetical protein
VVYSHEPLSKLDLPRIKPIIQRLKNGFALDPDDKWKVIKHWSEANHLSRRPPFFAKDFTRTPPLVAWLTWLAVQATNRGHGWFRRFFSPSICRPFDLLVKEIGWPKHAHSIVHTLQPELIILIRHPCAVVASQLRGRQLGLMPLEDRIAWLREFAPACAALGYKPTIIEKMDECEWLSLHWLITNRTYLNILGGYRRGHLVVYEDLCRDPALHTKGVFRFLGWRLGTQTLRFLRKSTQCRNSAWESLFQGQHPYFGIYHDPKVSASKWRHMLTRDQSERIIALTRPFVPFDHYWGLDSATAESMHSSAQWLIRPGSNGQRTQQGGKLLPNGFGSCPSADAAIGNAAGLAPI